MRRKRYVMKSYVAMVLVCVMSLGLLLGNSVTTYGAEVEISDAIAFVTTHVNVEGALVLTWEKDEDITINHLMRQNGSSGGYVVADELRSEDGVIVDSSIGLGEVISYRLEGERSTGDMVRSYPIHIRKNANYVYEQVLFEDDFTDSDATFEQWSVESGNWTVTDGHIEDQGGGTEQLITAGSNQWSDYSVTVDMKAISNSWPFMMMRYQDASNFYFLQVQFSNNKIILGKRVDGSVTEYSTDYSMTMGDDYQFKVELSGDVIRCYAVEGTTETFLLEETLTEFDSGRIGLRNKWTTANFNSTEVTSDISIMNESDLQIVDVSTDEVALTWQAVQGVTSYRLYRQEGNEQSVLIYEGTDTSYRDTTVSMNTSYEYYMNYEVSSYTSQDSEVLSVTTDVEVPDVVNNVTTYAFSDAIRLEWDAVEGATGYRVYGSDTQNENYTELYSGTDRFYVEENLASGVVRYYRVTAENMAGEGSPSDTVTGTTRSDNSAYVLISGSARGYLGDVVQLSVTTDLPMVNYKVYRQSDGKIMYVSINRAVTDQQTTISLQTNASVAAGDYILVVGNSEAADSFTVTLQTRPTPPSNGGGNSNSGRGRDRDDDGDTVYVDLTQQEEVEEEEIPENVEETVVPLKQMDLSSGNLRSKPYINGFEDGTFRPNASVSREGIFQMIFQFVANDPEHTTFDFDLQETREMLQSEDPSISDWALESAAFMMKNGLVQGDEKGSLEGENSLTRGEFITIISRLADLTVGDKETQLPSDIKEHWAKDSIEAAYRSGIINGYPDGTFLPDQPISRAEAIVILSRVFQRADNFEEGKTFDDVTPDYWAYGYIMNAANGDNE